jgi:sec1 family domain-containing protein 1
LPRNEVESRHGRVTAEEGIDLDAKDFFWAKNAANPFPQVAEDIDTELNRYKQDAAEITRSTDVSGVNDITQLCDFVSFISPLWLLN